MNISDWENVLTFAQILCAIAVMFVFMIGFAECLRGLLSWQKKQQMKRDSHLRQCIFAVMDEWFYSEGKTQLRQMYGSTLSPRDWMDKLVLEFRKLDKDVSDIKNLQSRQSK